MSHYITASLEESEDITQPAMLWMLMWYCGVRLYGVQTIYQKDDILAVRQP